MSNLSNSNVLRYYFLASIAPQTAIIYREDIHVDSKCNKVNEMVKSMAEEDESVTYIDNSILDSSGLNGSRLHLNTKGFSLLAVQFIKFLRSGSGRHANTGRGFQMSSIQQLGKILMELGSLKPTACNRKRPGLLLNKVTQHQVFLKVEVLKWHL